MKKFIPTININKEKFNHTIKYVLIATILVVLFFGSLFLYQKRQIISSALITKPESFTELYFENHTVLPTKIVQKNTSPFSQKITSGLYSFSFTIHNLENKDMQYSYETYSLNPQKAVIDHGKIFIKTNDTKTIKETFSLPILYPRTEIVVNLVDKNQQVDFWMEGTLK